MRIALLLPFALMLSVSACSLLPGRPPSPALHDFGSGEKYSGSQSGDWKPGGDGKPAPWSKVAVDAPEWLQNENIRYRLLYADPTRVRFYSQDRWLAPPPSLLAQRLSMALGGHGHRLKIRLLEFEQVFDSPPIARVILAFHAMAYGADSEEVVAEKVFRLNLPSPTPDAKGAVSAVPALIEAAANALKNWLAELPIQ